MTRHLIEFQSKYLLRKVEVIVYIPGRSLVETINQDDDYYKKRKDTYPLMLLLSGFGSSKSAWEQSSNVVALAQKHKIALCMLGGENKWYMNFSPIDNFEGFINKELPEFLYSELSSLSNKEPLYIAGCSMGGYGALRNYLLNLDRYKACGVFSPATKPDNNLEEVLNQPKLKDLIINTASLPKNVYLSVGSLDFIYKESMEYNKFLIDTNCGFTYKSVEGYDHSFKLWNEEIECFLDYIDKLK